MRARMFRGMAIATCISIAVGGCAVTPQDCQLNQTTTGALVGAGIGGALGGIAAAASGLRSGPGIAVAAGAILIGAAIGAAVGHHNDQVCHQMAMQQALDQAMLANATWQAQEAQRQQDEAKIAAAQAQHHQRPAVASAAPLHTPAPPPEPEYMSVAWANQMTNTSGAITPLNSITAPAIDQVCMEFSDSQVVNGVTKTVRGKACHGPDGKWNPIE